MTEHKSAVSSWGANLLVTGGVVVTAIMALLLALLDSVPVGLPPLLPTEVANLSAPTLEMTNTPRPATPLPSATPTPPPTQTFVPTKESRVTATATAVPVLPTCGNIPASWVPYTVQSGDTYFYLSAQSGATISEIVEANCLDPNFLISGIVIYLPQEPPVRVACGPPAFWVRYTVQAGDTMFSLAMRHGTTVYAIMQANCLTSTRLFAGRNIYLPPLPATATPPPAPTSPPPPPPTATALPPTATQTPIPATFTPTATSPPPTATPTFTPPAPTVTPTPGAPTLTPTLTPPAPTATPTLTPPLPTATPTFTPPPSTATPTFTPPPPTATPTFTPPPPADTPTHTPTP